MTVTRYTKPYPRVALAKDLDYQGDLIEQGPECSEVKWDTGVLDTCAINRWITRINEGEWPGSAPLTVVKRTSHSKAPERAPDDLSDRLKAYDPAALKQFALNNGVWDAKYETLPNPGLVRMSVINRLRARVKKGHKTVWR